MKLKLLLTVVMLLWANCALANNHPATVFPWPQPGQQVIGDIQYTRVAAGETLLDIAERYALGFADIRDANPNLDPWIPEVGAEVVLPTQYILPAVPWQGIVVNLAEYRLYHFLPERQQIHSYPIGIGQSNSPTPQGDMHITARIPNPTWYPPASVIARWQSQGREVRRQIPAGPDNPLGPFAINLSAQGYLIHGTNQRFGIGAQASAGCIRMNNWDIEALVGNTQIGVAVRIIDQPVQIGVLEQQLYLKAQRSLGGQVDYPSAAQIHAQVLQAFEALGNAERQLDLTSVEKIYHQRLGISTQVTL
ncbi:MAG: hypothetical protein C0463_04790 [Idiomarina sp.]|nr:hypothetical protein [Idiomarina sp.]MCL5049865.1 L,D-transpeptidase family protein [Bacillota bacterium]